DPRRRIPLALGIKVLTIVLVVDNNVYAFGIVCVLEEVNIPRQLVEVLVYLGENEMVEYGGGINKLQVFNVAEHECVFIGEAAFLQAQSPWRQTVDIKSRPVPGLVGGGWIVGVVGNQRVACAVTVDRQKHLQLGQVSAGRGTVGGIQLKLTAARTAFNIDNGRRRTVRFAGERDVPIIEE